MVKMSGIYKLVLCFFLSCNFLSVYDLSAQDHPRSMIRGRVVDESSGEPLVFVNVFIANTTIGTTTDTAGHYIISNIPYGTHELVVSMMGYEVVSVPLTFNQADMGEYDVKLKPRVLQFPEVKIEAEDMKQWRQDLDVFKREFLGRAGNSAQCLILNPEVLNFQIDEESGSLIATAVEPLEIINRALGYRLYAILVSFSLGKRTCQYVVKPKFEELVPADEREDSRWQHARIEAYNGSFRHFITALANSALNEEGFFIWETPNLLSNELTSLNELAQQSTLFSPSVYPFEIELVFPHYLRVEYVLESDNFRRSNTQISFLKLLYGSATVSTTGYSRGSNSIVKYGRWTYDRIAEELPFDYRPDTK